MFMTDRSALITPPECHPRQQAYTFLIRILSTSFISVSIFSVCCYSRVSILMRLPFHTEPVALTEAAQLRAEGNSSCCYILIVHNHPSWATSRKVGMAWYSRRPMPSLWFLSELSRVNVHDSFGSSWTLLHSLETCLKRGKSLRPKHGILVSRSWRTIAGNPSSISQTEFLKLCTFFVL